MRQMSGQDAAFLYGETPNWHMHVSGLVIIDPSTHPDGPGPEFPLYIAGGIEPALAALEAAAP